jgi:hypothetical protein
LLELSIEGKLMGEFPAIKSLVPWWSRIALKIIFSRIPIPYSVWKRMGMFVHGDMNNPQKAFQTYIAHGLDANVLEISNGKSKFKDLGRNWSILELGPGDSLFSALIGKALGASSTWLVDAGDYATKEFAAYEEMLNYLSSIGYESKWTANSHILDELLRRSDSRYLTEGVQALSAIPSRSINYCFSNAVLEHIPRKDFDLLAKELYRVLDKEGSSFHRIDLKDHLGGSLNNLRFSEKMWEGPLFSRSGFYTNRLRYRDIIEKFTSAGFRCNVTRVVQWPTLPIDRKKLDPTFEGYSDDELRISGFDLQLTPK